ncbi:MAG: transglutaminase domain-containing protein [Anaerolineae bacterium]|nr:transglutaminase domain-containing protein [Anaerolineae bacterium]
MSRFLRPRMGWATIFLMAAMLLTVAWSLEAANWADGLWTMPPIVLGGLLIGILFGSARWLSASISHLVAIALGVVWTAFCIAWVPSLIPWEYTWGETTNEMWQRLLAWFKILREGGISSDNLIFVLQLGLLMWLVAYLSGWTLYRLNYVWISVLLAGFAILTNLYYAAPDLYAYLIVFMLAALLLVVRHQIYQQETEWQVTRVGFSPDIGWDFLRDGAIFAIVVVALAWLTPTIQAAPEIYNDLTTRFEEPLTNWQTNFNRLFSSLNYRPRPGPAYFSNTLALTGAVNLGDQPIFDAKTEGGIGPRYWRSVVYDQYTGRGWVNSNTSITALESGDPRLSTVIWNARTVITQTITMIQPGGSVVHAVAQPIALGLGSRAQFGPTEPIQVAENKTIMPLDVTLINANRVWRPGDTFTVVSAQSIATVKELKTAGTDYPKWVRDKYLQVPESVTPRVRELARQITQGKDTPFEKALAIEAYLRQIKYNENIASPPPGQDLVDWFLFEMREGYCDYYASAFNVLARSVGIPSRLAAGYSRGEYIAELGIYRQHEFDAHSWPEVFFPNLGWIEFEPTAASPTPVRIDDTDPNLSSELPGLDELERLQRDALERPLNIPPEDLFDDTLNPGDVSLNFGGDTNVRVSRLVLIPLGLLLLAALLVVGFWVAWYRDLRGLNLMDQVWEQVLRFARLLGLRVSAADTPYEVAQAVGEAVPEGQPDIERIADIYVEQRYGGPTRNVNDAALSESWGRSQRVLWQRWMGRLAERLRPKFKRPAPSSGTNTERRA